MRRAGPTPPPRDDDHGRSHGSIRSGRALYSQTRSAGVPALVAAGLDAALAFQGWLDTRTLPFPGERDRTCDTVAEMLDAAHLGRLWALIVEFQSEPDPEILDRLLEYLVRLRREFRYGSDRRIQYWTAACLLNLTGPTQTDELDMVLPCTNEVRLRFRPHVRTLRDDDAAATLHAIEAGTFGRSILPWIPLMHGGGDLSTIEVWKRMANLEPDGRLRSIYASLALGFRGTGRP